MDADTDKVFYCPHCRKPLYDHDALRCLYCGERLDIKAGVLSLLKWRKIRVFIITLVLFVVLAFVLLVVF